VYQTPTGLKTDTFVTGKPGGLRCGVTRTFALALLFAEGSSMSMKLEKVFPLVACCTVLLPRGWGGGGYLATPWPTRALAPRAGSLSTGREAEYVPGVVGSKATVTVRDSLVFSVAGNGRLMERTTKGGELPIDLTSRQLPLAPVLERVKTLLVDDGEPPMTTSSKAAKVGEAASWPAGMAQRASRLVPEAE
jgi:hypothetical protein